jgi:ssDNA-binding Zn-finger/Zn-ribbon topoisomerase 1
MKIETTNTACPICGGKMDVKHVSSEAGRRLLKCPICGGEFMEVLSHWERNGKVVYENPEIQLTPIRKVLERNQRQKGTLVSKIKQRIESEYRKHPDLDWAEIAARKIYARFFENKK